MKKYLTSFQTLTKFEKGLWLTSLTVTLLSYLFSYLFSGSGDLLNLIASLIGVTALIFVAKGLVLGQLLTVVFSVFYGIISVLFAYYGEMITYLFMTTPMAIVAADSSGYRTVLLYFKGAEHRQPVFQHTFHYHQFCSFLPDLSPKSVLCPRLLC